MFETTEGVADCEIRSVIRFLNARNVLPSEIHHQICQVYGDNAMSDGMVRKCVRMFNEGRENVHDEVFVALGIQHAMRMRCIIFSYVVCLAVKYFSI